VQGINETNAGYFTGTNKTYLLTPLITLGTNASTIQNDFQLSIYPNPAQEELNVAFRSEKYASANIAIIDMFGRKVLHDNNISIDAGITKLKYRTHLLSPGLYQLIISSGSQVSTNRISITQ
jgi:hypothetical protein